MESESESRRSRLPKSSSQESDSLNKAVSVSNEYKNSWAANIFAKWLSLREVKVPVLDSGVVFKEYEFHKVQALSAHIAEMDALSLNYWVSKFVLTFWTVMRKCTANVLC